MRRVLIATVIAAGCSSKKCPPDDCGSTTAGFTVSTGGRQIRLGLPSGHGIELELDDRGEVAYFVQLDAQGQRRGNDVRWEQGKLLGAGGVGDTGTPHGLIRIFGENGSIAAEHEYRHGRLHGRQREWFDSGHLHVTATNDNGWPVERTEFFPDGTVQQITRYVPRSDDHAQIKPWRLQRRCGPGQPMIDLVVDGNTISNMNCDHPGE